MKKEYYRYILLIGVIVFLLINLFTLKKGHNWGGDFSQYIIHAKNIVESKSYSHGLALDSWVVCAPGFPFILAPFIKFFGLNFQVLKSLNVLFWLLFVLALYPLIQKRVGDGIAVATSLLLFSSHYFFIWKQNILSDIPFVFFITFAIYALTKYSEEQDNPNVPLSYSFLVVAIVAMVIAFFIRYVGVVLFAAALLYFSFIKKDKKACVVLSGALLTSIWIQSLFGASAKFHLLELNFSTSQWLQESFRNFSYVLTVMLGFVIPSITKYSFLFLSFMQPIINLFAPLVLIGALIVFVYKFKNKTISLLECFFYLYFFGLIVWPLVDGPRYLFPIIGLVVVVGIEWLTSICQFVRNRTGQKDKVDVRKFVIGVMAVLIVVNVVAVVVDFGFNDDDIVKKETQEMVQWIKENTNVNDHLMFKKPRVLGLLTERVGATFWYDPSDRFVLPERLKIYNINYLVNTKYSAEFEVQEDNISGLHIIKVWENEKYRIFKIDQ